MKAYNKLSLTRFAATLAKLMGVEKPAYADEPVGWVCDVMTDLCKEGFDRAVIHNPDAMGMFLYEKYPDIFAPVLKHTQITIPFQTVMPSVTPVCFGTMYTGALPRVHGIQKYEKPVIQIDSFFDALIRAGKKVAIVATDKSSMSMIFGQRDIDVYILDTEANVVEKAQSLILEDRYDVLCVYTIGYDKKEHHCGPESPEGIAAAYRQGTIFDQLVSTVKRNWKKHNTLISFSPDHGAHDTLPGTLNSRGELLYGNHGTDCPEDINILHYLGVVLRQRQPG